MARMVERIVATRRTRWSAHRSRSDGSKRMLLANPADVMLLVEDDGGVLGEGGYEDIHYRVSVGEMAA